MKNVIKRSNKNIYLSVVWKAIELHAFEVKIFFPAIFCFILSVPLTVLPQKKDEIPKGVIPPPLGFISKSEKKELKAVESNQKKRTKLALSLMASRLEKSQKLAKGNQFEKSLSQLGGFKALLQDTLRFLKKRELKRGYHKNIKNIEMTLRLFLPKLELIRRQMPFKYSYHVTQLMKTIRKVRDAAMETLFDDTIIPKGIR